MPPIQWISCFIALFVLFLAIFRLRKNKDKRLLRMTIIFLMIHVLIFYFFVVLNDLKIYHVFGPEFNFSTWSSILRFHSLLTYALLEGYGWWRDRWK